MSDANNPTAGPASTAPGGVFPVSAFFPLAVLAVVAVLWASSWKSVETFDLPRPGDTAALLVQPVGEWTQEGKGFLGLKIAVAGPQLPSDQPLRFTEGSQRVHAVAKIVWLDEKGLPVGEPSEKPFKDDC